MMYVDNQMVLCVGSVELYKVHTQQYKHNMYTNKLGVVKCLDKCEVARCDKDVVILLDEGVLTCLDKNNQDDFDRDFIHAHPLENIYEETLGGNFLVHHGFMQKIGLYETYSHFCYHHNYKTILPIMITCMM